MARQLKPCGSPAAYNRHLHKGEEVCAACRQAHIRRSAEKKAARAQLPFSQIPHGEAGYNHYGCRCNVCGAAQSLRLQAQRASRKARPAEEVPHGLTGYNHWDCRCDVCEAAKSESNAAYRASLGGGR